jgi:hypothetical protein
MMCLIRESRHLGISASRRLKNRAWNGVKVLIFGASVAAEHITGLHCNGLAIIDVVAGDFEGWNSSLACSFFKLFFNGH